MRFIEAISRKFYSMEWEKQRGGKSWSLLLDL
jgi:hypothetical protein